MATVIVEPSQQSLTVAADETILEAALRQGFNMPYGCKNGACGACKGRVLEGEIEQLAFQRSALTAAEQAAGYALFCCAKAKDDLRIECREVTATKDIQIRTLPCRVEKIDKAGDVAILTLKLPTSERLQFLAGQYIDIHTKGGKKRSFSLASSPELDGFIELHIRNVAGGSFSEYVFHDMKPREIMRFTGPLGSFFLREDSDKPIIFIASGTGFAPIKSIVEHMLGKGADRDVVLYWGCRSAADLYLPDLPRQWASQLARFRYVPVLSEPDAGWSGRTGLVHEAVLADYPDLSGHQVYACGAPVMVEAAHTTFTGRGLPSDEFYSDAFFLAKDQKPLSAV